MGGEQTPAAAELLPVFTGSIIYTIANDLVFNSTANASTQGIWITTRTAASGAGAEITYKNGVSFASFASASAGNTAQDMIILAVTVNGVVGRFTTDTVAAAFMGGGLNSTQAGNVNSRIHTYLVALGVVGC
jgi:ribosomal protein S4E